MKLGGVCGCCVSGPGTPPADLLPAAAPPAGHEWLEKAPLPGLLAKSAGAAETPRLKIVQRKCVCRRVYDTTFNGYLVSHSPTLPVTFDFLLIPFSHPAWGQTKIV